MRLAVDAARETADHHEPGRRKLAPEHARDLSPVPRAGARADDRDRGLRQELGRRFATEEHPRRRVADRTQERWESAIRPAEPSQPTAFERLDVRARVERLREGGEAGRSGLGARVDPALRRERGEGELPHGPFSSFGSTVRECLRHVRRLDRVGSGERGDRRRDARDTRTSASRERQLLDGPREQRIGLLVSARSPRGESRARRSDPLADRSGSLALPCGELDRARARDHDHEVETIEQRARELVAVRGEPLGGTRARDRRISARAARAQIHRPDELERRRVERRPFGAGDADLTVLERLSQCLQSRAGRTRAARRAATRRDERGLLHPASARVLRRRSPQPRRCGAARETAVS